MALRPEDRYASARALADDIEHWLADEPVSAWREPFSRRARRWARRHRTAGDGARRLVLVCRPGGAGGVSRRCLAGERTASWHAKNNRTAQADTRATADEETRRRSPRPSQAAVLEFFQDDVLAAAGPKDRRVAWAVDVTVRTAVDAAEPKIDETFAGPADVGGGGPRHAGRRPTLYLGEPDAGDPPARARRGVAAAGARPRPPRHARQPRTTSPWPTGRRPARRRHRAATRRRSSAARRSSAPTTPTRSKPRTTSPRPTATPAGIAEAIDPARGDAEAPGGEARPRPPRHARQPNNLAVGLPGRRPASPRPSAARGDAQAAARRSSAPTTPTRSTARTTSPRPTTTPAGYAEAIALHEETLKLREGEARPRPPRHAHQSQQPRRGLPGRRPASPRPSRCTRRRSSAQRGEARPRPPRHAAQP